MSQPSSLSPLTQLNSQLVIMALSSHRLARLRDCFELMNELKFNIVSVAQGLS